MPRARVWRSSPWEEKPYALRQHPRALAGAESACVGLSPDPRPCVRLTSPAHYIAITSTQYSGIGLDGSLPLPATCASLPARLARFSHSDTCPANNHFRSSKNCRGLNSAPAEADADADADGGKEAA